MMGFEVPPDLPKVDDLRKVVRNQELFLERQHRSLTIDQKVDTISGTFPPGGVMHQFVVPPLGRMNNHNRPSCTPPSGSTTLAAPRSPSWLFSDLLFRLIDPPQTTG